MISPTSTIGRPSASSGRLALLVFAATLSIYVATAGGSITSTDGVVIYSLTESLVERGSIALETGAVGYRRGHDGRMYSWFGIGQSVYNIPFYLAGRGARDAFGLTFGKSDTIPKAAVAMGSTVPAAGCAAVLFLFAWRLTRALRPSLVAAFALAFGTILWPYARFGFNLPLAAFLVVSATYQVWRGVREGRMPRLLAGGLLLGCAFLTRHELPFLILPLFIWVVTESWPEVRRVARNAAAVSVGFAPCLMAWFAYNAVRFGHPLDTGQHIAGQSSIQMLQSPLTMFGQSMSESLAGLLFSPSTSVFLYSPLVVLGLLSFAVMVRHDRTTTALLTAQILLHFLFLAAAGNWFAGRAYGSRYLVTVIPLVCIPLVYWFRDTGNVARKAGYAILAVSVLVQLPGVLVDYSKVEQAYAQNRPPQPRSERLWSWPAADLFLNAQAAARRLPENVRYLAGVEDPPRINRTGTVDQRDFAQQFAFSLDFWWLYLFYLGVLSAPVALLGLFVPLLLALASARKLSALVRDVERADRAGG
jgi:hypothetical protein